MAATPKPRPGDCFEIPLSEGCLAYAHYVYRHRTYGSLVSILAVSPKSLDVNELPFDRPLFPPVFVGLHAAVSQGGWRLIGNRPVTGFSFPLFRYNHSGRSPHDGNWKLWDGSEYTALEKLTPAQNSLEELCVWGYLDLQDRILEEALHPTIHPAAIHTAAMRVNSAGVDGGSGEQALLIRVDLADIDWSEAVAAISTLAVHIASALDGIGDFDGEEFGEGICTLYCYGRDAEQLFLATYPLVQRFPLSGRSSVTLRSGPPGFPERVVSVSLDNADGQPR